MAVQELIVIKHLPLKRSVKVVEDHPTNFISVNDSDPKNLEWPNRHFPREHSGVHKRIPEPYKEAVEKVNWDKERFGDTLFGDAGWLSVLIVPHFFKALLLGFVRVK